MIGIKNVWHQQIKNAITPLSTEWVPLGKSIGRIPAQSVFSPLPLPRFSESLRDGFLLYREDISHAKKKGLSIKGTIAAGAQPLPLLQKKECARIFTGGRIATQKIHAKQNNCTSNVIVVPYEWCLEKNGRVFLKNYQENNYIFYEGAEVSAGAQLIAKGVTITSSVAAKMMAVEITGIEVYRRAKIAICCTGNELVHKVRSAGEKISINEFLLKEGLRPFASTLSTSLVSDNPQTLLNHLQDLIPQHNLLVTSGGTGNGEYDLIHKTVRSLGAEIIFDQLPFRPGNILFGRFPPKSLGNDTETWIIALPGAPRAVATLLHELVIPTANLLQGCIRLPQKIMAELLVPMTQKTALLRIKSGVLEYHKEGKVGVRPAEGLEPSDCRIIYPAGNCLKKGELIEVHI